jgi:hypothetical protein
MIPRQEVIALANKLAWKCNGVEPRVARLALAVVICIALSHWGDDLAASIIAFSLRTAAG